MQYDDIKFLDGPVPDASHWPERVKNGRVTGVRTDHREAVRPYDLPPAASQGQRMTQLDK